MVARVFGGPEVIEREAFDPGAPAPGELLIAVEAVGLNFIDTYYRTRALPCPAAAGAGLGKRRQGGRGRRRRRTASHRATASAASARPAPMPPTSASRPTGRCGCPTTSSAEAAAATMLKGFTACYLAEDTIALQPGEHRAGPCRGGRGRLDPGAVAARQGRGGDRPCRLGGKIAGVDADHRAVVRLWRTGRRSARDHRRDTAWRCVYDGVGAASWPASLPASSGAGSWSSYGNASGAVPPISAARTDARRLALRDPADPRRLHRRRAKPSPVPPTRLFERMRRGVVKAVVGQRFALADAAEAHRALEGGRRPDRPSSSPEPPVTATGSSSRRSPRWSWNPSSCRAGIPSRRPCPSA